MPQLTVVIGSRSGLHARPAALFVQAASRQPVTVTIARDGDGQTPVDARSLLSVLALGARQGDAVVLAAEGEGSVAEGAVAELAALLTRDLDAGE